MATLVMVVAGAQVTLSSVHPLVSVRRELPSTASTTSCDRSEPKATTANRRESGDQIAWLPGESNLKCVPSLRIA